jgi:hypothetical protein
MVTARSLWEAEAYVALELAQREPSPGEQVRPAPPLEVGGNVIEGPDAWTYRSPVGEITVPYASERSSDQLGAHFGLGRSRLIDAAQWVSLAQLYGDRAIEDQLQYAGEPEPAPGDREHRTKRYYVELSWELAIEAILQALEFLPEGADRIPDSAIWTAFGAGAVAEDPHLVTRARLEEDLEYYRGVLADFRNLYEPES